MKQYAELLDVKVTVDAVIGIKSEVDARDRLGDYSLVYRSPTGVELLRVGVGDWTSEGRGWRIDHFCQRIPPIQEALEKAGEKVA